MQALEGEWYPDLDAPILAAAALDDLRLDILLQQLGIAGGTDSSRQLGFYQKILQAFRTGELGRSMLDDVT